MPQNSKPDLPSRPKPMKMVELARLAGVSVSTVSRALADNPLIPEQTRKQIKHLASVHGYKVNQFARNLRLGRTQTIGVVLPLGHDVGQLISDPFFLELIGRLADEITLRGFDLLLHKVQAPDANWLQDVIDAQRMDGIIVIGQSDQHDALNAAAQTYQPLLVWGGALPGQVYCSVGVQNVAGAETAVTRLLAAGRRRILFMGNTELPEVALRYQGYRAALKQFGLMASNDLTLSVHFEPQAAEREIRAFLDREPSIDAIFASSDVIALTACTALAQHGLSVPNDVAVIGFDDISHAARANPALTTVRQDLKKGAATLVDLLFRRLDGEETRNVELPAELIIRQSCGTANVSEPSLA